MEDGEKEEERKEGKDRESEGEIKWGDREDTG